MTTKKSQREQAASTAREFLGMLINDPQMQRAATRALTRLVTISMDPPKKKPAPAQSKDPFVQKWGDTPEHILGVDAGDPLDLVATVYRGKARYLHSDKGGDPERWARITAAYNELQARARKQANEPGRR